MLQKQFSIFVIVSYGKQSKIIQIIKTLIR
jgi:hypothetical protein